MVITRYARLTREPTKESPHIVRSSPNPAISRITGSVSAPASRKQIRVPDRSSANRSTPSRSLRSDMGRRPLRHDRGQVLGTVELQVLIEDVAAEQPGVL